MSTVGIIKRSENVRLWLPNVRLNLACCGGGVEVMMCMRLPYAGSKASLYLSCDTRVTPTRCIGTFKCSSSAALALHMDGSSLTLFVVDIRSPIMRVTDCWRGFQILTGVWPSLTASGLRLNRCFLLSLRRSSAMLTPVHGRLLLQNASFGSM